MRLSHVALLLAAGVLPADAVGSCDQAVIAVNAASTSIFTGIAGDFAECAAEAFNYTTREKCVAGVELVCAATAAQIVALGNVKLACTTSLPSLGCDKSLDTTLKTAVALSAACAVTLKACKGVTGGGGVLLCLNSFIPFTPLVLAVPGFACTAVHACNNCSAPFDPNPFPSGQSNDCDVDFVDSHPECSQFGGDVSCCEPRQGLPCSIEFSDTPKTIVAYGTQEFCCPKDATVAKPCTYAPPPVMYKCSSGKCVPNASGVSKEDCEAACGSLFV